MNQTLFYIIFFIVNVIIAFFVYRKLITNKGLTAIKKNNTTGERWASQSKPTLGGIGFYTLFLISSIVVLFVRGEEAVNDLKYWGIFGAASLAFFMGLYDDLKDLSPAVKFVLQFVCGGLLIVSGIVINIFEAQWINYLLTLFWVVALMNSLNMLDNMDAITASTSATIITGIITIAHIQNGFQPQFIIIAYGALAAFVSFLFWNWNPSKIYMGDNGSMFVGLILATLSIRYLWNVDMQEASSLPNFSSALAALFVFIVPISDTATVSINRLMQGKSPFVGGKDHTTHNLSYLGFSDRQVAMILISVSLVSNIIAVYLCCFVENLSSMQFWGFFAVAILIFVSLYSLTRIPKRTTAVQYEKQQSKQAV